MSNQEYKKSFEDEVDWAIINQLHSATSKFSNASMELKKMYVVLLGIAIPGILKLSDSKLDMSLFITVLALTITFWYLDAYTFFYQEKLRAKMDDRFVKLSARNKNDSIPNEEIDEYTLPDNRKESNRWTRAFKDSSTRLYQILFALTAVAFILFLCDVVK